MQVGFARYIPRLLKRRTPPRVKAAILKGVVRFRASRKGEKGVCPACGHVAVFAFDRRWREDVLCPHCLSFSRTRHVALTILDVTGRSHLRSLRELAAEGDRDIYVTASAGSTAAELRRSPRVTLSEYYDDVPPGTDVKGTLCQDLQNLSFPDERFDIVVSEDVFEHVADYRKGFCEVHRVLKPGGTHVFTIPYDPQSPTLDRFEKRDGVLVPILPIEYHGDSVRGAIPAITSFGYDLPDKLTEIGFDTTIRAARDEEIDRYKTYGSFTFVSVKRRDA